MSEHFPGDPLRDHRSDHPLIVRFAALTMAEAIDRGAADIHITGSPEGDTLVRFRIDGIMVEASRQPAHVLVPLTAYLKARAGLDPHTMDAQDGCVRLTVRGVEVESRMATAHDAHGPLAIVRLYAA